MTLKEIGKAVINPINPIKSKRSKRETQDRAEFLIHKKAKSKKEKINFDIIVEKNKIIIKADPEYASQNIEVFADQNQIFTGSLSRKSEINLSLLNKEGRKILKEIDRNKEIYGRIK